MVGNEIARLDIPVSLASTGEFKLGESVNAMLLCKDMQDGSFKINRKTSMTCQYPGCSSQIFLEEHHLNPQKNIPINLTAFERKLISSKRKTITVCREHHKILHGKKLVTQINV